MGRTRGDGFVFQGAMAGVSLHEVDPRFQYVFVEAESFVVPAGPNPSAINRLAHACLESPDHRRDTIISVRNNPMCMP